MQITDQLDTYKQVRQANKDASPFLRCFIVLVVVVMAIIVVVVIVDTLVRCTRFIINYFYSILSSINKSNVQFQLI